MPATLHATPVQCEADAPPVSTRFRHTARPVGRRRSPDAHLAVVPEGHRRSDATLDGGFLGPVPNPTRRVNRGRETQRELVLSAVPRGSLRAAHGGQVLAHLRRILDERGTRADGRRNRLKAMAYLIARTDYDTMTCRPGWQGIAEVVGCHHRTVGRYLAEFEAWGLLGRVAGGRQAQFAPPGPDGERINEAAVYVLCVPSPLALLRDVDKQSGDINATPPALGGTYPERKEITHTRAREKNPPMDVASPRVPNKGAASGAHLTQVPWRPEIRWPAHRTTRRKIQRLAAASEIYYRSFPLRSMSIKDIASCCRDFLLAGWTVSDVLHALDHKPDGTLWPHSGAPATKDAWRMRGWLGHRLAAWRSSDGEPLRSRDQRASAAADAARRRKEAFQREVLTRQTERAARLSEGDCPAKVKALAQIRSMIRAERSMSPGMNSR